LLIFFSTVLLVLSFLITTTIQSERDSQSVLTRTLTSDTKAQGSSNDRINSIYEGIAYSYNNFKFFWGAGSFLFKSSWAKSHPDIADVPPHNAIIFLFIQFGIFVFFVYYAFYIFFKKILLLKLYIVGVLFLLIIFFLPSVLYTFTGIILLWFVDVLSYQPYQKKTIAHNMNNQKQFDA
jgi:hypothetical protein